MSQEDLLCCRLFEGWGKAGWTGGLEPEEVSGTSGGWSLGTCSSTPGKGPIKGEEGFYSGVPLPSFALRCFLLNLQSDSPSLIKSGVPRLPDSSRAHTNGSSSCGLLSCPLLVGSGLVPLLCGRPLVSHRRRISSSTAYFVPATK